MELVFIEEKVNESKTRTMKRYRNVFFEVREIYYTNRNGQVEKSFIVESLEDNKYLPSIDYNDYEYSKPVFELHTRSFGTMTAEDFEKFVEAQRVALETVKLLNAKFS